MADKVYVTYENSIRCGVTGVYANKKLAEKEKDERGDLDVIDTFELKGYSGDGWDMPIPNECNKYYTPHLDTIRELIACLYNLEGCLCGGLAHIITDDNNIEDHHIKGVLEDCNKEKNKNCEEVGLVKLICEELLKLNIQQRIILFSSYYTYISCNHDCENCLIEKGDFYEIYKNL